MTDFTAILASTPEAESAHTRWCLGDRARAHDRLDDYEVPRTAPREPCTQNGDRCISCYNCVAPCKTYNLPERIDLLMGGVALLATPKPRSRTEIIDPNQERVD